MTGDTASEECFTADINPANMCCEVIAALYDWYAQRGKEWPSFATCVLPEKEQLKAYYTVTGSMVDSYQMCLPMSRNNSNETELYLS